MLLQGAESGTVSSPAFAEPATMPRPLLAGAGFKLGLPSASAAPEMGKVWALPLRLGASSLRRLRCSLPAEDLGSCVTITMVDGTEASGSRSLHHCLSNPVTLAAGTALLDR